MSTDIHRELGKQQTSRKAFKKRRRRGGQIGNRQRRLFGMVNKGSAQLGWKKHCYKCPTPGTPHRWLLENGRTESITQVMVLQVRNTKYEPPPIGM